MWRGRWHTQRCCEIYFKNKPGPLMRGHVGTAIDEIVLHGTEGGAAPIFWRGREAPSTISWARPGSRLCDHPGGSADGPCGKSETSPDRASHRNPALDRHRDVSAGHFELRRQSSNSTSRTGNTRRSPCWSTTSTRRRRKIARNMVVGHGAINNIVPGRPIFQSGPLRPARSMSYRGPWAACWRREFLLDPRDPQSAHAAAGPPLVGWRGSLSNST